MRRLLPIIVTAAAVALTGLVPTAEAAAVRKGLAGYCPNANGVTVVVDYQELGGATEIRCATGAQPSGLAALENAGFVVTGTQRWGKAFVCRINGKPTAATEPCFDTPPASAYWSYWHAPNNGTWAYSNEGASTYKPATGSFEGWSFSKNHGPDDNPPPRVAPKRPALASSASADASVAAVSDKTSAAEATHWLAGQLRKDGGMPGFNGVDWGLTIDALLAMKAARTEPKTVKKVTTLLSKHVRSYITYDDWGPKGVRVAGATGKMMVAARAGGADPKKFGGWNLRNELLGLMAKTGNDKGRFKDKGTQQDYSNTFGQSFGLIGLARTGGVPKEAVDYLIRQQCKAGGFRLSPDMFGTPTARCDADPKAVLDPDSTAMAVQALLAVKPTTASKAAAKKGAAWLAKIQRKDGSFGGSGPTSASNANSTGLAGQALYAAGNKKAGAKAAAFIKKLQLTKANAGKAKKDRGAIAYNAAVLKEAKKKGIAAQQRDQWRRATPQAVLAVAKTPLGKL